MSEPLQQFVLPRALSRVGMIGRIALILGKLSMDKAWRVEVHEHIPKRSHQQNAYLWAIYGQILRKGGEELAGFDKNELHEFFLINHFGEEVKTLFGRKKVKPLRRSSGLNKQEFADFVESILRFMAQRGIYIESPEEHYAREAA